MGCWKGREGAEGVPKGREGAFERGVGIVGWRTRWGAGRALGCWEGVRVLEGVAEAWTACQGTLTRSGRQLEGGQGGEGLHESR